MFHCIYRPHFPCPFICWWTFGLPLPQSEFFCFWNLINTFITKYLYSDRLLKTGKGTSWSEANLEVTQFSVPPWPVVICKNRSGSVHNRGSGCEIWRVICRVGKGKKKGDLYCTLYSKLYVASLLKCNMSAPNLCRCYLLGCCGYQRSSTWPRTESSHSVALTFLFH